MLLLAPGEGLIAAVDRPQAGAVRPVEPGFQLVAHVAEAIEAKLAQEPPDRHGTDADIAGDGGGGLQDEAIGPRLQIPCQLFLGLGEPVIALAQRLQDFRLQHLALPGFQATLHVAALSRLLVFYRKLTLWYHGNIPSG